MKSAGFIVAAVRPRRQGNANILSGSGLSHSKGADKDRIERFSATMSFGD